MRVERTKMLVRMTGRLMPDEVRAVPGPYGPTTSLLPE